MNGCQMVVKASCNPFLPDKSCFINKMQAVCA